MQDRFDWDRFVRRPLVGILRNFANEDAMRAARAAADGGLTTLEVTLNTAGAVRQIEQLKAALGQRVNVGAGTVCTVDDVRIALGGGATFVVTPIADRAVVAACREAGVPVFVGAMTPTEIFQAWRMGATMVKLFPADAVGATYLGSVRGPLEDIPLMPTGGVTVEKIGAYRRAGAAAFGIGGSLFDKQRVAAGDWLWIETQAKRFIEEFARTAAATGYNAEVLKSILTSR